MLGTRMHGMLQATPSRVLFGQQRPATRALKLCTPCQAQQQQVILSWPDGKKQPLPKPLATVGSDAGADLQLSWEQVEPQHAKLDLKGGRLFCTALTGDPEELLSATRAWLNGAEMRPGVSYMVAPGSTLAFGTPGNCITVDFTEQGGSSAMADMLMKGMASQANQEVRQQLDSLG